MTSPTPVRNDRARKGGAMDRHGPAYKGQAGYNPVLLAIYDPWVLGFMARAVWHTPIPVGIIFSFD